ncbi:MAG: hypothetical protein KA010_00340, partial [Saprospiraceae bacterium]|nr:hypothetical protein [Saprospiraceae bacterium]
LQECRKKVEQNRNEFSNTPPPYSRASTRGSAWCDIEYLNKKIISGFIVFSNTWTDSITCHSFNFDFLQNKEIKLDDILNNIPARDVFIDRYISSQVTALPQYTQRAFRDWIDEVDFSYFTIRQDGICFSTPYNTIFGQQHISIPYDKLKDFLKKSYTTLLSDKNND